MRENISDVAVGSFHKLILNQELKQIILKIVQHRFVKINSEILLKFCPTKDRDNRNRLTNPTKQIPVKHQ
jgi:hypothetical protein